jgi:hypothetical protein
MTMMPIKPRCVVSFRQKERRRRRRLVLRSSLLLLGAAMMMLSSTPRGILATTTAPGATTTTAAAFTLAHHHHHHRLHPGQQHHPSSSVAAVAVRTALSPWGTRRPRPPSLTRGRRTPINGQKRTVLLHMAAGGVNSNKNNIEDPFSILGLSSPTADVKEIKRAYKRMALKFHPGMYCLYIASCFLHFVARKTRFSR